MMKMMILAALAQIPYHDGKEERRDEGRDGRDAHADCLLCWLAEGLDGVPYGQRSLRR